MCVMQLLVRLKTCQTLHDPRLGALPEGWMFGYGRGNKLREGSVDRDGVPRAILFENRETGEVTGLIRG